jgi:hypothetical protein
LVRKIFGLERPADFALFYRGHSNKERYKLEPSLFRNGALLEAEHLLFRELLVSNPADFSDDASTLDKLVRMQHHSLPTRLLDVTSNPLIALYFACKSSKEKTGEVIVFKIKKTTIKFFDSDTASCIANLARLTYADKLALDLTQLEDQFNVAEPTTRLLHFIREEKPYFVSKIKPADLSRIVVVRSKLNNNRILSQSGAFLLFGIGATLDGYAGDDIVVERISVKASEKEKICTELDELNINESTVFPYIENSAKYIARKYEG